MPRCARALAEGAGYQAAAAEVVFEIELVMRVFLFGKGKVHFACFRFRAFSLSRFPSPSSSSCFSFRSFALSLFRITSLPNEKTSITIFFIFGCPGLACLFAGTGVLDHYATALISPVDVWIRSHLR